MTDPSLQLELQKYLIDYLSLNDDKSVSPSILWEGAESDEREDRSKLQEQKQTTDKKTLKWLLEAKQDPDMLLTYEVEGGLRFTGRTYDDLGNRASRLLAVQLRKAQSSQVVRKIRHPITNQLVLQPKEIANALTAYYTKLYDSQNPGNKTEKVQDADQQVFHVWI